MFDLIWPLTIAQAHSPVKPVLVFVASRRQTRLTALDLIGYAAADERPRQFVHCAEPELDAAVAAVQVRRGWLATALKLPSWCFV
jgi:hypothetical protein